MKHDRLKLLIAVLLIAFTLSLAVGVGVRLSLDKNTPAVPASVETEPDLPAEASSPEDPNAPKFTVSPPETAPPETSPAATEEDSYAENVPAGTENTSAQSEPEPEPETESEPEPAPESQDDGIITVCIGGDTSIDGEFADFARGRSPDYPWEEISDVMNGADIAVVNLETCVSDRGVSEKREGYGFETPPEMLEGFVNAGIDAVNLANNHTRDFGYDALLDTFSNLKASGISYFGAGKDSDEASDLKIFEREGIKVGFVGANKVYLSNDCAAGEDHAGINQIGDPDSDSAKAFIERISEYDSACDVLIVFLHAGTEETFEVTSYQKEMARKFIDAGADIVVGGHSHTLQPIEFYSGKPIIYSIGNLIFWHIDDDLDGLTAIFEIEADKNGFRSLKLHPLFIKNYKVYYLKENEGQFPTRYRQIIDLMNHNCAPYGTQFDDNGIMHIIE